MSDPQPGDMKVESGRRSIWSNLSLVWIVPIAALVITLLIAWRSWSERGARIEIRFENAAGVVADETALRFRDVVIGRVEDVSFADDLESVVVTAAMDQNVADALPADARFWVVRPEVSASGISGLSTVLSGVYIQAAFEPSPGSGATSFEGLDTAPLVLPGMEGTKIVLRAEDGNQLSAGAPIFHQGIEVGRIETPRLLDNGNGVIVDAFIEAPHDQRITTATRFWDTSGFRVNFGPGGLNLSVGSVAALLRGGIAYDTVFSGGNPVEENYVFDLFDGEDSARDSVFNQSLDNAVELTVEFDESVQGLEAGSPVTYRGLRVGNVTSIGAFIEETGDRQEVRLRAVISIDPRALGLDPETPAAETIAFLSRAVQDGLRARLASQSLFNRTLTVQLVEIPDAEEASLGIFEQEAPLLPSVESDIPDVAATAEGLLNRVDNLPVEELLDQAITTMAAIESLAADEGLRDAPQAFTGLLEDARGVIGSEEVQALPAEIGATIAALRGVAEELQEAGTVTQLTDTLASAETAAGELGSVGETVREAIADVPGLVDDLRALSQKANALQLEATVTAATEFLGDAEALVANADAIVGAEQMQALPEDVAATVASLRAVTERLQEAGAVDKLVSVLESADSAAAGLGEAGTAASAAVEDVPGLVEDLRSLAGKANALQLEAAVAAATEFLGNADSLVASEAAQGLPAELSATVTQLRGVAEDLREADAVGRLVEALESASEAADSVTGVAADLDEATAGVPQLIEDLDALVAKANGLPVEQLVNSASAFLEGADRLIDTPQARALPESLSATLDEARAALSELRAGGVVENTNATLASAREAASAIEQAAQSLPALSTRIQGLVDEAGTVLDSYGDNSSFNRETVSALREVREAAEALTKLAREIERNPNSLLFGR
ncbi:MlaD family protein [Salipiger mucosus]|uniref:Paraquat-inducible protein B n=1 Tax=Salipiger mucosus DSM 16094 TaxID=1123237 RepID=S9QUJ4_9RHOB|nr:MlaD family protein [Salipiger mucosus]EPX85041.1 Paraquat-inducible protein B [Salipiger mucosus DSM 16094]